MEENQDIMSDIDEQLANLSGIATEHLFNNGAFTDIRELHYPSKLTDSNVYPAYIRFQFYNRISTTERIIGDGISLMMPDSISNPSTVSWDSKELGFVVGTSLESLKASGKSFSTADLLKESLGSVGSKLLNKGMGNILSKGTASLGSELTGSELLGLASNIVENPYYTMLFRGVNLGSMAFDFKFTPYNENECDVIDMIIKTFRRNYLPNKTNKNGTYLGYPSEVDITYFWQGKQNRWLRKHKRCSITSLVENLTPTSSLSIKRNAFPNERYLSLELTELEITTREDVEKGY